MKSNILAALLAVAAVTAGAVSSSADSVINDLVRTQSTITLHGIFDAR